MSVIVVDRTRIEADWTCPRKRYWLTEFRGTGVVPYHQAPALRFGILVHEGLEVLTSQDDLQAALLHMQGMEEWAASSQDEQWMAEALVTGFSLVVWPRWVDRYERIGIEQELEMEHDGVLYMVRPDVLLRDTTSGDIWYPDFKTFTGGWKNRKWMHALQQQLTVLACEKAVGEPITGAWVQGLNKGYVRAGKLYHPLVYGYRKQGAPGLYATQYTLKRKAGFERFPAMHYENDTSGERGIGAWIRHLLRTEAQVVRDCFPATQPIFLNRAMMTQFLEQRTRREKEIAAATDLTAFPQTFSACEPYFGTCPYLECCWEPNTGQDPVGSGLYIERTPHHAAERQLKEGSND